jgi:hypothetical protein
MLKIGSFVWLPTLEPAGYFGVHWIGTVSMWVEVHMIDSHSRIPTRFLIMMVAAAAFFGTTAVALSLLQ